MTETEACHKIDQWLLIPVDYDQVLESLSEIRGSDRFEGYVGRVADAEFKSAQDVIRDVDQYISKQSEKNSKLEEQLSQISGGKIQSARYEAEEEDLLDIIARDGAKKNDPNKKFNDRFSAFVQNRMSDGSLTRRKARSELAVSCRQCGQMMEIRSEQECVLGREITLWKIFLFLFFPAALLLLFVSKEKHYYYCPRCGQRKDKD